MRGVQAIDELLGRGREQVSVSIHGDLDQGMIKMDLDRLWVRPVGDQQCRTGVSEIVRSQLVGFDGDEEIGIGLPWEVLGPLFARWVEAADLPSTSRIRMPSDVSHSDLLGLLLNVSGGSDTVSGWTHCS